MKKVLLITLFLVSLSGLLIACSCGHCGGEVLGDYPNSNYVEITSSTSQIALHGTARVQRIYQLSAGVLKAPGLHPATYTDLGLNGSFKFVKGINEVVGGAIALPCDMDRSTTTYVRIGFASTETTGTVIFLFEYKYISIGEDVSVTVSEDINRSTTTVSGTSYGYTYANHVLIAPSATDKIIQFRITRIADEDTCASNVYVIGISLVYYANKLGV